MTNGYAPTDGTYRLGGKGGRMATAWQLIWDRLDRTEYRDATVLAAEVAGVLDLKPISIISHLHRMAKEGHLDSEVRKVEVAVVRGGTPFKANRQRTFYRIQAKP